MSTPHNPATCPCGGHECDACHAIDPGYSQPWGWPSVDAWDEFVEGELTRMVMAPGYVEDSGHAWCVLVIIVSTVAMALLSSDEVQP